MKILQIIPNLGSGGAERFVVDLCNEHARMGHDVTLCTLLSMKGPYGFNRDQVNKNVKFVSLEKNDGFSISTFFKLRSLINSVKPDIIHTHLHALPYAIGALLFSNKGLHTVHSNAEKEAGFFAYKIIRKILFKSGRVMPVTISKESEESFEKFYGYSAIIIENGRNIPLDLEVSAAVKDEFKQYMHTPQTRCLVQLARFGSAKNIPMMARVAKRLKCEGYDFSILNIGLAYDQDILNEVLHEKPDCQYLLGVRKNPLEYLKEAGAYALSSSWEGLPISLIEAMGVGAIPVCTPVGGIVNIIRDKENGFISKDITEDEYYKTLKSYLETSEEDLAKIRINVLNSYKPYTMSKCAEKYIEAYKRQINMK